MIGRVVDAERPGHGNGRDLFFRSCIDGMDLVGSRVRHEIPLSGGVVDNPMLIEEKGVLGGGVGPAIACAHRRTVAGRAVPLVSAKLAVCWSAPEVPVNVTVALELTAPEAAVRVTCCGELGERLRFVGETVTPAGTPLT